MLAGLLRIDALAALEELPEAWRRTDRSRLTSWM
jgi:hypothetical protein